MNKILDVINPYTGERIESINLDDIQDLEKKVQKAAAAQPEWEKTTLPERSKLLLDFLDRLESEREELGRLLAREMAKPIREGIGECINSAEIGRGYIERAKHLYGDVLTGTTAGRERDLNFTRREALGVVTAIIPFNYPVEMFIHKLVPALIMGNTVIVKAPSSNPLTIKRLVQLAHEAEIPDNVIQFTVCERKSCAKALLANPKVAAIGLTGSTEAGIDIIKSGADTIKKVFLELGGNDPFIICEDADLDIAVQGALEGRSCNNGQVCCASKRFIVHKNVKEQFVSKLKVAVKSLVQGNPLDPDAQITCLISEEAAKQVEAQILHTVEQGGRLVCGGKRHGAFVEPTIIDEVPKDADIAVDMEIFGQVWPIISFETEGEAVAVANQSKYGLMAGILSSDIVKAFQMADQIQASGVVVNGHGTYRSNEQGFGGCKATGLGNEGVGYSLEEYSRVKTYILKEAFVK
ncbi:aldehyde dehydrogenase family protein [bacterium 210820-DFI.6.37]|nr:aldehyde dehydrogenase family protein [bacterium 210820-DFI.6.37]